MHNNATKNPLDVLFHIFSIQNVLWMFTGYTSNMIMFTAHTWTMPIEIYVSLFMIWAYKSMNDKKKRMIFLYACVIVSIAYRSVLSSITSDIYLISLSPLAHVDAFAIGCLLAEHNASTKSKQRKYIAACLGAAGLIGIILCLMIIARNGGNLLDAYNNLKSSKYYLSNPITANLYLCISLVSYALIEGLITLDKGSHQKTQSRKGWLEWTGDRSYELYLFHYPIVAVVIRVLPNSYIGACVALVITFMAVLVYIRFILPVFPKGMKKLDTVI